MEIELNLNSLEIFEALANDIRIKILRLLGEEEQSIKELATKLDLSNSIMTRHIKKLETSGMIETRWHREDGATKKICSLKIRDIQITIPVVDSTNMKSHELSLPVGQFTNFHVTPTCGLAKTTGVIGQYDDARYFWDPERTQAGIIWFKSGFLEYNIPLYETNQSDLEEIQFSMEISSEAPGFNPKYPSDIFFTLNGVQLGEWTSPGDFGDKKGKLNPTWWPESINQYGLQKLLRVTKLGTFMDGQRISYKTIKDCNISGQKMTFKMGVNAMAKHVGGLTIFGKGFGNYNQDITVRFIYN